MSEFSVFKSDIEFLQFEICLNSVCGNLVGAGILSISVKGVKNIVRYLRPLGH